MSRRNPFSSSSDADEPIGNPFVTVSASRSRNPFDDDDDDEDDLNPSNLAQTSAVAKDPFGLDKAKCETAVEDATASASLDFAARSIRDKIANTAAVVAESQAIATAPIATLNEDADDRTRFSSSRAAHPPGDEPGPSSSQDDAPLNTSSHSSQSQSSKLASTAAITAPHGSKSSPFAQVSDDMDLEVELEAHPQPTDQGTTRDVNDSISGILDEIVDLEEENSRREQQHRTRNVFDSDPPSPIKPEPAHTPTTGRVSTEAQPRGRQQQAFDAELEMTRLVKGRSLDLMRLRSIQAKLALLDKAVACKQGKVILQLVLYLERSLSLRKMAHILAARPLAWRRYCQHLRARQSWQKLQQLYALAPSGSFDSCQLQAMLACTQRRAWQWPDGTLPPFYNKAIVDFSKLLAFQAQVDAEDAEKEFRDPTFQAFPKRQPLQGSSLDTTLYYITLYHCKKVADSAVLDFIQNHNVHSSQAHHVVTRALIRKHAFEALRDFHSKKSMFGATKLAPKIKPHLLCQFLHASRAPAAACGPYVEAIGDVETRYKHAAQLKCHSLAIQALIDLKDGERLRQYGLQKDVQQDAGLQARIYSALRNDAIAWKS
eukprot:TRINITY_DN7211_c0_g2_i1.p1 TRINITY_DN7211_c0_g2~~TRINITY_DN7211_c0_g2_i1.p1  ORF type:complete len:601 (+),score=123.06 TRINITY_DN7211_c0_g2_i1:35-1837(+)